MKGTHENQMQPLRVSKEQQHHYLDVHYNDVMVILLALHLQQYPLHEFLMLVKSFLPFFNFFMRISLISSCTCQLRSVPYPSKFMELFFMLCILGYSFNLEPFFKLCVRMPLVGLVCIFCQVLKTFSVENSKFSSSATVPVLKL